MKSFRVACFFYGICFFLLPHWGYAFPGLLLCLAVETGTIEDERKADGRPVQLFFVVVWQSICWFATFVVARTIFFGT